MFVGNDSLIDPRSYAVDVITAAAARLFLAEHHYLPNYPAAILNVGLFCHAPTGKSLVGVATFATPATNNIIRAHTGLENAQTGTCLARLSLLDQVPGNGESYFVSRAFSILRKEKPHILAVVSYSDEAAGHIGQVYQALSAQYRGRTAARTVHRIGSEIISGRTLSKIRLDESGIEGAIQQMQRAGADPRRAHESAQQWLARLTSCGQLTSMIRSGLHAYCFPLTLAARLAARTKQNLPYPRIN